MTWVAKKREDGNCSFHCWRSIRRSRFSGFFSSINLCAEKNWNMRHFQLSLLITLLFKEMSLNFWTWRRLQESLLPSTTMICSQPFQITLYSQLRKNRSIWSWPLQKSSKKRRCNRFSSEQTRRSVELIAYLGVGSYEQSSLSSYSVNSVLGRERRARSFFKFLDLVLFSFDLLLNLRSKKRWSCLEIQLHNATCVSVRQ